MKIQRQKITPNKVTKTVVSVLRDTGKPATRRLIANRLAVKVTPHLVRVIDAACELGYIRGEKWYMPNGLSVWVYFPAREYLPEVAR